MAVSWIGVATRGIVGPTQKLVGFFEQLGSSFKLASTSCGVLKVVFLNVRAVLRCRELQLCTNFDAFGQLLGALGRLAKRPRRGRIAARLRASLLAMSNNYQGAPAHVQAAFAGDVGAVEAWISGGGDVNQHSYWFGSLLSAAIVGSQTQMREFLLERGARCGKFDVFCLCEDILTKTNHVDIARLLIEHGADPAMGRTSDATWATSHKLAVIAGFSTTQERTAIRCALLMRLLVERGAPVDARLGANNNQLAFGTTPLMVAAIYSAPVVVLRELLRLGADLSATTSRGESALSLARRRVLDNDASSSPAAKQAVLTFLNDVSAAGGTYKRYVNEPRKRLLVLSKLCERGRATAPRRGALARLFPTRRSRRAGEGLPDVLFWKVLSFWRTSRDGQPL